MRSMCMSSRGGCGDSPGLPGVTVFCPHPGSTLKRIHPETTEPGETEGNHTLSPKVSGNPEHASPSQRSGTLQERVSLLSPEATKQTSSSPVDGGRQISLPFPLRKFPGWGRSSSHSRSKQRASCSHHLVVVVVRAHRRVSTLPLTLGGRPPLPSLKGVT